MNLQGGAKGGRKRKSTMEPAYMHTKKWTKSFGRIQVCLFNVRRRRGRVNEGIDAERKTSRIRIRIRQQIFSPEPSYKIKQVGRWNPDVPGAQQSLAHSIIIIKRKENPTIQTNQNTKAQEPSKIMTFFTRIYPALLAAFASGFKPAPTSEKSAPHPD